VNSFDVATDVVRRDEGDFAWAVLDGWQQGRGAWGGLVVGALVRAVLASEPDAGRTVRAVSAQLVAPAVVGEHRIRVSCVRSGNAVSTWTATLMDDSGQVVAVLTAVLGSPRRLDDPPDFTEWALARPPGIPVVADVPQFPLAAPMGPVFAQHMNFFPVQGIPAMREAPQTTGWIGYREVPTPSAAALIALVDGWWPASLPAVATMRAFATVTFTANLLVDPATVSLDEPLMHHSFVSAAHEGYTSEVRHLWTGDGRLAVDNLQTMVLIA
jgi:hypothetical protein